MGSFSWAYFARLHCKSRTAAEMAEDFRVEKQQRGRWGEGGAVRLRSNIDPHWSNLTFVALCIMQTSNLVCRLCCHSNSKSFIWKKIHERRAVSEACSLFTVCQGPFSLWSWQRAFWEIRQSFTLLCSKLLEGTLRRSRRTMRSSMWCDCVAVFTQVCYLEP